MTSVNIETKKSSLLKNDHLLLTSISIKQDNNRRKNYALKLGLPEFTTWNGITDHHAEVQRKELIKQFELVDTSTWKDISEYYCDIRRINEARKKGLLETASWSEINNE